MQRVILLGLACIVFIVFGGCSERVTDGEQVNPEERIIIRFTHVTSEDSPKGMAARRYSRLVSERTGGRVEVQVFSGSSLFRDGEELEALRQNQVQMIAPATSKLVEDVPEWEVLDLPYLFESHAEVHRFIDSPQGQELLAAAEDNEILPLAYWDGGFKQITNSVAPMRRSGDFEGLRFRVMIKSPVLEGQFRALGASSVPLTFDDLYGALETKRVDGQENTVSNIVSQRLYEVQPFLTVSNHGFLGYAVLVNREFWEGLEPNLRAILEQTLLEVSAWEREQAVAVDKAGMLFLEGQPGLVIHQQTPAEQADWEKALAASDLISDARAGLIEAVQESAGGGEEP